MPLRLRHAPVMLTSLAHTMVTTVVVKTFNVLVKVSFHLDRRLFIKDFIERFNRWPSVIVVWLLSLGKIKQILIMLVTENNCRRVAQQEELKYSF